MSNTVTSPRWLARTIHFPAGTARRHRQRRGEGAAMEPSRNWSAAICTHRSGRTARSTSDPCRGTGSRLVRLGGNAHRCVRVVRARNDRLLCAWSPIHGCCLVSASPQGHRSSAAIGTRTSPTPLAGVIHSHDDFLLVMIHLPQNNPTATSLCDSSEAFERLIPCPTLFSSRFRGSSRDGSVGI